MNQRIPFHIKHKEGKEFLINYYYNKEVHAYHNIEAEFMNDRIFSLFNLNNDMTDGLLANCNENEFYYLEIENRDNYTSASVIEDRPSPEYLKLTLLDHKRKLQSIILEYVPEYYNYYNDMFDNSYYFYHIYTFGLALQLVKYIDEEAMDSFTIFSMGKDFVPHKIGMRDYIIDNVLNK